MMIPCYQRSPQTPAASPFLYGPIDLGPMSIDPRTFHLPDYDQILKVAPSFNASEVEAMCFIPFQTSVVISDTYESCEWPQCVYLHVESRW